MAKQLKEIEIPFGAYDSELDGFEYTIPEGYEAEIKDGKIVVRKIESKDEKIRKEILDYIIKGSESCYDIQQYGREKFEKWIAWLEKQGGHAKFINGIQVGDKVTRNEDGVLVNLSQLNRVAKKDKKQGKQKDILEDAVLDSNKDGLIADTIKREKQGEQKPIDKIQLGKKYKCIASPRYSAFMTGKIYRPEDKFLCSLMNFCSDCFEPIEDGEQKPADKVEPRFKVGDFVKDANHHGEPIYEIIGMDNECYICEYRGNKSMGDKSLTHFTFDNPYLRLVEQKPDETEKGTNGNEREIPNSVWSDGDIVAIDCAVDVLSKDLPSLAASIERLKSLRPQNTWKPSDEQMESLASACDGKVLWLDYLNSLYQDLKKLKG